MNVLRALRRWRERRRYEAELAEELEFHLDHRTEALQREGLDAAAARRRARLELGAIESHKDAVRAAHGLAWLDGASGELRRTIAGLLRAPVYFGGASVVLALAVAMNLVAFAMHQAYVGTPPPTARAGALYDLVPRNAMGGGAPWLTHAETEALREALGESVLQLAISEQTSLGHAGDPPRDLHGMAVDSGYFRLLAARPALGRAFEAADDADPVPRVVLGHAAWLELTSADPDAVGKAVVLGGVSHRVIGVMPAGFAGLEPFQPQFWVGAAAYEAAVRHQARRAAPARYGVTIQLAPGASAEALADRLLGVLAALPDRHGEDQRIAAVRLLPREGQVGGTDAEDVSLLVQPLFALLLLVLLIACANLANLMLARALARRRELAIRAAIGASRLRLVGLLLLEAAVLAMAGCALGLLLAFMATGALHDFAASAMSGVGMQPLAVRMPPSGIAAALVLALVATLAIGIAPALAATGGRLAQATRIEGGLLAGRVLPSRLRAALVAAQVAASAVLLLLAAIGVSVAHQAGTLQIGYPTQALVDLRHPAPDRALDEAVARLPGVLAMAAMEPVPLYGHPWPGETVVDGTTHVLSTHYADHRVRELLGLPLRAGRWFTEDEARDALPVAVVGTATAARLWPGMPALGRSIAVVDADASGVQRSVPHVVVGVIDEVATGLLVQGVDRSALWLPGHAEGSIRPLRERVLRIDAGAALLPEIARTCIVHAAGQPCVPRRLSDVAAWQRLPLEIARGFAIGIGLVALLISAAGLWGGASYTVAARAHEIGVRRALGALAGDVLRLVLGGTLRQLAIGLLLALPVCVALALALADLAGAGTGSAIVAFGSVVVLLLATTLAVTAIPARRAIRIPPTEALREH